MVYMKEKAGDPKGKPETKDNIPKMPLGKCVTR